MGQSTAEVKRDIEQTREDMSGTIDAIADRTSPSRMWNRRRQRIADRFRSVRTSVMGSAENAAEGTGSAMQTAREGAGQLAESVQAVPGQAREQLRTQTQGNPMAAGMIAFGAGLLASYLVPPTSTERRVAQQVRQEAEPAMSELKEAGRELAGEIKGTAEQAVQETKETATDAARQVADEAKSSAEDVREEARTGSQRVSERARNRNRTGG